MQGRKQHTEKLFLSFQLSDRVPADNFYRRLKDILDLKWLYKQTAKYYGHEGNESIDPTVFFKLMLIGYLENLGSDRRIINTVSMRMDMLFFVGYDIDEPLPWHSTLSRTRQLYGDDVFKELFKQVLKQCIDKGMVAGKRQAIDSVFVKANASMDSLVEKEVLQDADTYTDQLKSDDQDDNDDDHKANNNTVSSAQNKRVQQHHAYKEKAYKGMPGARVNKKEVDKDDEKYERRYLSNHTHFSTTDADARVSVKPGKPRQLNYLAQVSVDTNHHVITNIEAHLADKKDSQCLANVLTNTIENLHSHGLVAEEILADTGYSSGEALKALDEQNIVGYIPNFGQYKATREGFIYDKEHDRYTCTKGKHLVFKKIKTSPLGYTMRHYRSSAKDCKNCPLKTTCIGKSNEKKIDETIDKPLYDKMHARLQTPKAKRMKKLRSSTVEPVIGTLVNFLAMKRVNTRGLQHANKCMLMAAIAYNIKKLLKFSTKKANTIAQAMQIKVDRAFCLPLFNSIDFY